MRPPVIGRPASSALLYHAAAPTLPGVASDVLVRVSRPPSLRSASEAISIFLLYKLTYIVNMTILSIMSTLLNESDLDRRQTVIRVAAGIFVRFGYKKTSMDEVAQAVGLSRQGLYLHFPNKETLFREVVAHLASTVVDALDRTLERPELDLEERLHAGFLAMYSGAFGAHDSEHLQELFASAVEICPDELAALDEKIVASLARILEPAANGLWSSQILADTLYSASYGWKHRGISPEDYSLKMKNAVRLVCAAKM